MIISVDIDIFLSPTCSQLTLYAVHTVLKQLFSSPTLKLLFLVSNSSHAANVLEFVKNSNLPTDRCLIRRWQPVYPVSGPLRHFFSSQTNKISRQLKLGIACWHGAFAHIDLLTWPTAISAESHITQALIIVPDVWRPNAVDRFYTQLKSAQIRHRLQQWHLRSFHHESILPDLIHLPQEERVSISSMLASLLSAEDLPTPPESTTRYLFLPSHPLPSLAWVSPMPPEQTGIADYSADLLGEIEKHYDVTIVSDTTAGHKSFRRISWLRKNGWRFDRICYHIGNSPFHRNIRDCLDLWPGVVVLHECFLGDLEYSYESWKGDPNQRWLRELYSSHGYPSLIGMNGPDQPYRHLRTYSCNATLLKRALGVIVHSQHAAELVQNSLPSTSSLGVAALPLARAINHVPNRKEARLALGIQEHEFLVCSFGMVGNGKLSILIAEAWAHLVESSRLPSRLVFVGANPKNEYGKQLQAMLATPQYSGRAEVTGWVEPQTYRQYLAACDAAVQLRTEFRGETSAAVMDCLCAGIPTVVNRLGSMAEIPDNAVIMLPPMPHRDDISTALQSISMDQNLCNSLSANATQLQFIHSPSVCAQKYKVSLELFYREHRACEYKTVQSIGQALPRIGADLLSICKNLSYNFPRNDNTPQLLIDVSQIVRDDYRTGIQRVVRALILEFLHMGIPGFRLEPVWLSGQGGSWHYRYARRWTLQLLDISYLHLQDNSIETSPGDVLLLADLTGGYLIEAEKAGVYASLQSSGVEMQGIVYDILPIQFPGYFPKGADQSHGEWLKILASRASRLHCISKSVANDVSLWLDSTCPDKISKPEIQWFHLGANIENTKPSTGMPSDFDELEHYLSCSTSFLMVGTMEPRKGHDQAIAAFEKLLSQGRPFSLIIVGKVGWMTERLEHLLRGNPYFSKGIFWFESGSDEFVSWLYRHCSCLLALSRGEGFGLPLIESAIHGLPIIARDIPVFREVAGDGAFYFSGLLPMDLVNAIEEWYQLFCQGATPDPKVIQWQHWNQSAQQLLTCMTLSFQPPRDQHPDLVT